MDTRFWGPPAWILLHTLAFNYEPKYKDEYNIFFSNLQYVLPCIYCRVSYIEYIESLPISLHLSSRDEIFSWLYQIHNKVNDKLRSQGLLDKADPTLTEVEERFYKIYNNIDKCKTNNDSIMGWNFLYCVAFLFPEDGLYNATTCQYNGYCIFFTYLGKILPEKGGLRKIYNDYYQQNSIVNALITREKLKEWVYGLEQKINENFKLQCKSLTEIEEEIENYRAGCGGPNKDLKPTCRKEKKK